MTNFLEYKLKRIEIDRQLGKLTSRVADRRRNSLELQIAAERDRKCQVT